MPNWNTDVSESGDWIECVGGRRAGRTRIGEKAKAAAQLRFWGPSGVGGRPWFALHESLGRLP
jgi:hypothetical protein